MYPQPCSCGACSALLNAAPQPLLLCPSPTAGPVLRVGMQIRSTYPGVTLRSQQEWEAELRSVLGRQVAGCACSWLPAIDYAVPGTKATARLVALEL